ncbi:tagatose kinase [Paracoccus aestuariivivens]|uniref:Sugar kinase n=1 Tax=Paracoccus aestuariivivens TaxID=1820333 RepID=A0A6L6JEX4_9RHOB|nr:sugar kinase [Paracoccus aestuariivivens]MTH79718.1 sugar kinase [Paracoccus aestuariivivens]
MLAPDALGPTLCIGEIIVEIVATTTGDGFRHPQPLLGPFPSGAPAIFISQCGRLGGQSAMIGAVGADDFGALNLARLQSDGVDVSAVALDPEWPTGSAFVRYRADGSREFVFNINHSAATRFGWSEPVARLVARAGHLHVMGSALSMPPAREVIVRAAAMIKERGGTLSLDPNLRKELSGGPEIAELFQCLVGLCDLLLPSGAELFPAAGLDAPDTTEAQAIAHLLQRGVTEIVLKRGPNGASLFTPDSVIRAAPFQVDEVDPTGAGDCFGAAYVTCRRLGMGAEAALTYACAAGARNVTAVGPMEGAGTLAELDDFIRTTARRI